jgi:excisionase family DNA binding protein
MIEDPVSIAIRAAIKRAKRRKSPEVTTDDLLVGLFQVIARFDIVQIGPLTIDLEELGEAPAVALKDDTGTPNTQNLKEKYGFSDVEWRLALSNWQPVISEKIEARSKIGTGTRFTSEFKEKQLFSPDEAAEFLGVHTQTIRGYIRTGKLPALRLAGERALRIRREDLLALLEPYEPEEK